MGRRRGHVAATLTLVFGCWCWCLAGAKDCDNRVERLEECLEQVPGILEGKGSAGGSLPASAAELNTSCSAFKTGMGCVDEYVRCMQPDQRHLVEGHVAGARYTFRFLCDDPQFRREYLQYTGCYRSISSEWTRCADTFLELVADKSRVRSKDERLTELCCAKHGFLRCVYAASRERCRRPEAMFLQRIAETLSSVQVYSPVCVQLGVAVCGGGSAHLGTVALAASLLLTLRRVCC